MRVVVDYSTFVSNNLSAQVFYTRASEKFIAAYIKNGVTFEIIMSNQPDSWAMDFMTAINVIDITEG